MNGELPTSTKYDFSLVCLALCVACLLSDLSSVSNIHSRSTALGLLVALALVGWVVGGWSLEPVGGALAGCWLWEWNVGDVGCLSLLVAVVARSFFDLGRLYVYFYCTVFNQ
jgi:hypothetical protein